MKRFLASLLAMLLALTMLAPMSASAEDLDLEVAQNAANEEGLDLPEVAADIDLTLDDAIILDGLQSLQEDQGEIIQKPSRICMMPRSGQRQQQRQEVWRALCPDSGCEGDLCHQVHQVRQADLQDLQQEDCHGQQQGRRHRQIGRAHV